jgi:hypothetical protein
MRASFPRLRAANDAAMTQPPKIFGIRLAPIFIDPHQDRSSPGHRQSDSHISSRRGIADARLNFAGCLKIESVTGDDAGCLFRDQLFF